MEHVLLVERAGPVPQIATLWLGSASSVMCVSVMPPPASALSSVWFKRVLSPTDTMYGAVYQIWNYGYCWLDRPLGDDERTMYGSGCTGLVALAGPPAACGRFVVLDGSIQPYESAWQIDWADLTFGGAAGVVWPLPARTRWLPAIPAYNTSVCRLRDCAGSSDAVCAPCIYAHGL